MGAIRVERVDQDSEASAEHRYALESGLGQAVKVLEGGVGMGRGGGGSFGVVGTG